MSLRFSKKELLILLLSLLLFAIFSGGGYYLYIHPKKVDLSNKQIQLKAEEQLLAAVQSKVAGTSSTSAESVAELQKKVPVKKQLEQLILDIEKAEVLSNSVVSKMDFSEADVVVESEETPFNQEQSPEQATNTENNPTGQEQPEPAVALPEGIKKLTVTLTVNSPSYDDLINFIDTLENLNRLVVVEAVEFSGGSEMTKLDDVEEELIYSVTFSAFYMPSLEDLKDDLAELKPPAPSNKTNPFSSFPEL